MFLAEFDVAILHERLQGLDACILVLRAVDLLDREILADRCRTLPHDLGEVILELHRLHAELVVGPLVLPLEASARVEGVLNDLIRLALGNVRDHDIEVARLRVLRQCDDGAGVRLLVLAQRWVVRADEEKLRVGEVWLHLALVVPKVKPLFLEGAVLRVDGVILDLAVEGRLTLGDADDHEVVVGELLLP